MQGQTVPLCHRPKPWVVWSSIVPQQLKWTCSPHKNAMCSSFVSCALLLPAICSLTQPMIMASSSTFWCFRGSEGFASVMDVSLKRKQLNWVLWVLSLSFLVYQFQHQKLPVLHLDRYLIPRWFWMHALILMLCLAISWLCSQVDKMLWCRCL